MQSFGALLIFHRFGQLLFTNKWTDWWPIYSWLIEHSDGPLLIDVGDTSKINDKGYLPNNFIYHKAVQTRISKEDELDIELNKIGYKVDEIKKL